MPGLGLTQRRHHKLRDALFYDTVPAILVQVNADNTVVGSPGTVIRLNSTAIQTVDWGDGTAVQTISAGTSSALTHTYAKAGRYRIRFLSGWEGLTQLRLVSQATTYWFEGRFPPQLLRPALTECLLNGNGWTNDLSELDFSVCTGLTSITLGPGAWAGDVAGMKLPPSLATLGMGTCPYVTGALEGLTFPTTIRTISLGNCRGITCNFPVFFNNLTNAFTNLVLGVVPAPVGVGFFSGQTFDNMTLSGNLQDAVFTNKTAFGECRLIGCFGQAGDMALVSFPNTMAFMWLGAADGQPRLTGLTGNLVGKTWPTSLQWCMMQNCNVSGDLSAENLPDTVQFIYVNGTLVTGLPRLLNTPNIRGVKAYNLGLSQAHQDAWALQAWADWASFTWTGWTPVTNKPNIELVAPASAPVFNANAGLGGTYAQQGPPPLTGKAAVFKLVTDPDATGRRLWTWTYTNSP